MKQPLIMSVFVIPEKSVSLFFLLNICRFLQANDVLMYVTMSLLPEKSYKIMSLSGWKEAPQCYHSLFTDKIIYLARY